MTCGRASNSRHPLGQEPERFEATHGRPVEQDRRFLQSPPHQGSCVRCRIAENLEGFPERRVAAVGYGPSRVPPETQPEEISDEAEPNRSSDTDKVHL
jgi:hypothetical protein